MVIFISSSSGLQCVIVSSETGLLKPRSFKSPTFSENIFSTRYQPAQPPSEIDFIRNCYFLTFSRHIVLVLLASILLRFVNLFQRGNNMQTVSAVFL